MGHRRELPACGSAPPRPSPEGEGWVHFTSSCSRAAELPAIEVEQVVAIAMEDQEQVMHAVRPGHGGGLRPQSAPSPPFSASVPICGPSTRSRWSVIVGRPRTRATLAAKLAAPRPKSTPPILMKLRSAMRVTWTPPSALLSVVTPGPAIGPVAVAADARGPSDRLRLDPAIGIEGRDLRHALVSPPGQARNGAVGIVAELA